MEHINITFPIQLKKELDSAAKTEGTKRSTLIQKAVRFYLANRKKKELEKLMAEGYVVMADENLKITKEFENLSAEL